MHVVAAGGQGSAAVGRGRTRPVKPPSGPPPPPLSFPSSRRRPLHLPASCTRTPGATSCNPCPPTAGRGGGCAACGRHLSPGFYCKGEGEGIGSVREKGRVGSGARGGGGAHAGAWPECGGYVAGPDPGQCAGCWGPCGRGPDAGRERRETRSAERSREAGRLRAPAARWHALCLCEPIRAHTNSSRSALDGRAGEREGCTGACGSAEARQEPPAGRRRRRSTSRERPGPPTRVSKPAHR